MAELKHKPSPAPGGATAELLEASLDWYETREVPEVFVRNAQWLAEQHANGRITCAVPWCRCTKATPDGSSGRDWAWLCVDHWKGAPRLAKQAWRASRGLAEKAGDDDEQSKTFHTQRAGRLWEHMVAAAIRNAAGVDADYREPICAVG